MEVEVNYLAVLLAGLASMAIGAIYYADSVFGKEWKRLSGLTNKNLDRQTRALPWVFLASLLTAYLVAHVMYLSHAFYNYSWLSTGAMSAFWLWLGVAATTLFVHNAMELRPGKLTAIAIGNRLVTLLAVGLILGWLHP